MKKPQQSKYSIFLQVLITCSCLWLNVLGEQNVENLLDGFSLVNKNKAEKIQMSGDCTSTNPQLSVTKSEMPHNQLYREHSPHSRIENPTSIPHKIRPKKKLSGPILSCLKRFWRWLVNLFTRSSQKKKEVKEVAPNETGEQALVSQNKQNKDEQKHSPVSENKEKNEELIDTQKLSSNSRIFPENTKNSILREATTEKPPGIPKKDKPSKQLVEGQSLDSIFVPEITQNSVLKEATFEKQDDINRKDEPLKQLHKGQSLESTQNSILKEDNTEKQSDAQIKDDPFKQFIKGKSLEGTQDLKLKKDNTEGQSDLQRTDEPLKEILKGQSLDSLLIPESKQDSILKEANTEKKSDAQIKDDPFKQFIKGKSLESTQDLKLKKDNTEGQSDLQRTDEPPKEILKGQSPDSLLMPESNQNSILKESNTEEQADVQRKDEPILKQLIKGQSIDSRLVPESTHNSILNEAAPEKQANIQEKDEPLKNLVEVQSTEHSNGFQDPSIKADESEQRKWVPPKRESSLWKIHLDDKDPEKIQFENQEAIDFWGLKAKEKEIPSRRIHVTIRLMDVLFQAFRHQIKADTALYNSILPALELTLFEKGKFWFACRQFRKELLKGLKPLKESEIQKKINKEYTNALKVKQP
ncbi:hypothetical protein PGTUg99_013406 [Puccinia graminis f. sp. tritici]|uniref:Uncharacterized protein n=1 Tax=Puccinia graminis f. sp. tritici TaxID=56615 RepID=A0A5B0RWI2_PUCGR|nr:hypothetical protein PGTUg99_013406 [Puccinia graminis f. sp. tritici]